MTQTDKAIEPIRETARGIIIRGNKILLLRRTRKNDLGGIDEWLSIPGGALDAFETPEHAVRREIKEELGLEVTSSKLLAVQDVPVDESRHFYFLCDVLDGEPLLQEQSEEFQRMHGQDVNTYTVEWNAIDDPNLIDTLYWAYADTYERLTPFLSKGLDEPLAMIS